jgi:DNA-binding NtrC family response regulator
MADQTRPIDDPREPPGSVGIPSFRVEVVAGADRGSAAVSADGRLTIGSDEGATLRLSDPTVSRFHVELEATDEGIAVRDLGSTNGTRLGATLVRDVTLRDTVELELGRTRVRLDPGGERTTLSLSPATSFGGLVGASTVMRAVYTALEQAAPTTAPVLITGESGTGKELAARAVHERSPRAQKPYEVVDCGGLPPTLIESELFGHERGAFTGAVGEREGAFERAEGGTLFLDELGELPLEVQPKLLRALGEREVRRVGGRKALRVDVRIVAATNRDLRREVNSGRFRADLYYRLAVIQVRMPALRDRLEDLPLLCRALLAAIGRERGVDVAGIPIGAELWQHSWPGNARELRNYLEQLVILKAPPALLPEPDAGTPLGDDLERLPLLAAKSELLARFERRYVTRLLERTSGNVAEAARVSGVNRATLFRMIARYGIRPND